MANNGKTHLPIPGGVIHWEESAKTVLHTGGVVSRGTPGAAYVPCPPTLFVAGIV